MSTQTTLPDQQSVVNSYPAAKAVVFAKSPAVTVMSPPAKAKPASKASPMIRARIEYEMDENGDLCQKVAYTEASSSCAAAEIQPKAKPVNSHDKGGVESANQATAASAATESSEESEGEASIINEYTNATNQAYAAINYDYKYGSPVRAATTDDKRHRDTHCPMDEVPSRQIQAAVARVNKENISHHLSEATHKNKTDAVREQQRRSATQQWLSGIS